MTGEMLCGLLAVNRILSFFKQPPYSEASLTEVAANMPRYFSDIPAWLLQDERTQQGYNINTLMVALQRRGLDSQHLTCSNYKPRCQHCFLVHESQPDAVGHFVAYTRIDSSWVRWSGDTATTRYSAAADIPVVQQMVTSAQQQRAQNGTVPLAHTAFLVRRPPRRCLDPVLRP